MNNKILVLAIAAAVLLVASVASMAEAQDTGAIKAKGVTCEVICNGQCPVAPEGWVLSESVGESGAEESGYAAGRCAYNSLPDNSGDRLDVGTERMCCYFQG